MIAKRACFYCISRAFLILLRQAPPLICIVYSLFFFLVLHFWNDHLGLMWFNIYSTKTSTSTSSIHHKWSWTFKQHQKKINEYKINNFKKPFLFCLFVFDSSRNEFQFEFPYTVDIHMYVCMYVYAHICVADHDTCIYKYLYFYYKCKWPPHPKKKKKKLKCK